MVGAVKFSGVLGLADMSLCCMNGESTSAICERGPNKGLVDETMKVLVREFDPDTADS